MHLTPISIDPKVVVLSPRHPDEVIAVTAVLAILFVVGIVCYMTTTATTSVDEAPIAEMGVVHHALVTGSPVAKPRRLRMTLEALNSTTSPHQGPEFGEL
ncbi:hypothetical protein MRX96_016188 [Rhipicephalus microplus]